MIVRYKNGKKIVSTSEQFESQKTITTTVVPIKKTSTKIRISNVHSKPTIKKPRRKGGCGCGK